MRQSRTGARTPAPLFILVALLHLVPVWSVRYVPTTDGPSHTYNSWILHHLVRGDSPFLARTFEIDWRPHPNWLGHAFMSAAMAVVPPAVAEKLLVSVILLLFCAGVWMLGGPVAAFLALPLSYHLLLQNGFYNYSLGVALYPIAMAMWWRWRELMPLNALLLVILYFAHIVPAAMAFVSIVLLWVMTDRRPRHLLPLIPTALLSGWFALHPILRLESWSWDGALLWWPLWKIPLVMTFDVRQLWLGTFLAILYAVLIAWTVLQDRGVDPFLVLTALGVIAYLAAPIGAGEGLIMKARFLIFPYLMVLGFLAKASLTRSVRAATTIVLVVVSVANVAFLTREWRRADRDIERFLHPLKQVRPRTTLLPLLFDRTLGGPLPLRSHAVDYAAIDRELVDLDNYQAALGDFPVRFREGVVRPDISAIEASPGAVVADADYIYTWKAPVDWRAPAGYGLVVEEGGGRLYGK